MNMIYINMDKYDIYIYIYIYIYIIHLYIHVQAPDNIFRTL